METNSRIGRRRLVSLGGSALSAIALTPLFAFGGGAREATPVSGTPAASPEASPKPGEVRVRFKTGDAEIVVRIADNPTARDFLTMLPLTLEFSDFNRTEKISYLARELTTEGSTGHEMKDGDLIYFVPWGNLGFYYGPEQRGTSIDNRVILIGHVESGEELLPQLETGPVHVEIVS